MYIVHSSATAQAIVRTHRLRDDRVTGSPLTTQPNVEEHAVQSTHTTAHE